MPGNFKNEDLRVLKTRKALFAGLVSLLEQKKFTKITVHDICIESLVSRTAFYAHFKDKYDLLEVWLRDLQKTFWSQLRSGSPSNAEELIIGICTTHFKVISNILEDADKEQMDILLKSFPVDETWPAERPLMENRVIRTDFFAGGLINILSSRIRKNHNITNEQMKSAVGYVYRMMLCVMNCDDEFTQKPH